MSGMCSFRPAATNAKQRRATSSRIGASPSRSQWPNKSLLALRDVGPECEAESVRFHWRRVTKVGPVKHGFFGLPGAPPTRPPERFWAAEQGVLEAHSGAAYPVFHAFPFHEKLDVRQRRIGDDLRKGPR
jgi:hypothetical protein